LRERSFQNWCVHWANDMLVDERHLRHEQAYFENLFGWGLSHAWGTYGLVLMSDVERNLRLLVEEVDPQRRLVRITVRTCIGVTPDGLRIYVRGDLRDEYSLVRDLVLERMDCRYDILIRVDPAAERAQRVGYDPEVPLAGPALELLVEPHRQERYIQEGILKIAELEARAGVPEIDENYIPPCTGIRCHQVLLSQAERSLKHFERIRRNSLKIALSNRMGDNRLSKLVQADSIAEVFGYLCDHMAIWLGSSIDQLHLSIKMNQPPTALFVYTRQFFRLFDSILDGMGSEGRIKFYEKWDQWNVEFEKRALFDENIHRVLDCEYDHNNLWEYLAWVEALLGPLDYALEAVVNADIKREPEPKDRPFLEKKGWQSRRG